MPKGDDALRKKKNKVLRKRLNSNPAAVPARIAAIIAAKQRRKNGKRRMCEGMCFSLPTLDDPFNDRYINKGPKAKKKKKDDQPKVDADDAEGSSPQDVKAAEKNGKGVLDSTQQGMNTENLDSPSKFLINCLNSIRNAFLQDGAFDEEEDKSLLVNTWGIQFCKSCLAGLDILETTAGGSTLEQIAWIISTAADIFGRKDKEGVPSDNAFLLYLVPSQEKALKVRSVCKSLKALGIHTVSLHSGATVDHQMQGLTDCEPEFIVSTPERLLELVTLKAIDISGVSLLVVDGLEMFAKECALDKIKSIRQSISGSSQTVILGNCFDKASTSTVQSLLKRPVCRMSHIDSVACQSVCISQRVHVCSSEEEKLPKVIQILNESFVKQSSFRFPKVLLIAASISKAQTLAATLVSEGYTISNIGFSDSSQVASRKKKKLISVADLKNIMAMDIGNFEVIVIVDFPPSIDDYIRILTGMARETVNGVLHSFIYSKDASLAHPLTEVLEQCWQTVPKTLRTLLPC